MGTEEKIEYCVLTEDKIEFDCAVSSAGNIVSCIYLK